MDSSAKFLNYSYMKWTKFMIAHSISRKRFSERSILPSIWLQKLLLDYPDCDDSSDDSNLLRENTASSLFVFRFLQESIFICEETTCCIEDNNVFINRSSTFRYIQGRFGDIRKYFDMLAISPSIPTLYSCICSWQHACGRNCNSRRCDIVPRLYRAITVFIWHWYCI